MLPASLQPSDEQRPGQRSHKSLVMSAGCRVRIAIYQATEEEAISMSVLSLGSVVWTKPPFYGILRQHYNSKSGEDGDGRADKPVSYRYVP